MFALSKGVTDSSRVSSPVRAAGPRRPRLGSPLPAGLSRVGDVEKCSKRTADLAIRARDEGFILHHGNQDRLPLDFSTLPEGRAPAKPACG